jgi:hypothetical protein
MAATVLMTIALTGLGCQNKDSAIPPGPGMDGCTQESIAASSFVPASGAPDVGSGSGVDSGGALHNTLWSFVLGHDPGVATARDIESSFYSGGYDLYAQPELIKSARKPPAP